MSIKEILEKINPFYTLILLIVVAGIFFGLGRLSKLEETKTPIKIEYANRDQTSAVITATSQNEVEKKAVVKEVIPADGPVIGSKSGKKYYFPWAKNTIFLGVEQSSEFCPKIKFILPQLKRQRKPVLLPVETAKDSGSFQLFRFNFYCKFYTPAHHFYQHFMLPHFFDRFYQFNKFRINI